MLRCVNPEQAENITEEVHRRDCGGHLFLKATTYKILRAGFYWPTLFNDVFSKARAYEECQKFAGKLKVQSLPLKPIVAAAPFQQWGLDFIGEINPQSSGQHRYILTATDYFKKWIEAIPTRNAMDKAVTSFVLENICSRFGCPRKLVTDITEAFKSKIMVNFCNKYNIILTHLTPYYPQGNDLAESSNESLVRIIKKLLAQNQRSWDSKLKFALWADRISIKKSIGTSPFQLVYGTDALIPMQLGILVVKLLQEEGEETNNLQRSIF